MALNALRRNSLLKKQGRHDPFGELVSADSPLWESQFALNDFPFFAGPVDAQLSPEDSLAWFVERGFLVWDPFARHYRVDEARAIDAWDLLRNAGKDGSPAPPPLEEE